MKTQVKLDKTQVIKWHKEEIKVLQHILDAYTDNQEYIERYMYMIDLHCDKVIELETESLIDSNIK